MIKYIGIRFEDAIGAPVIAHELPDIFDRVELRTSRRQWQQRDVGRHHKVMGGVPTSLIKQEDRVGARGDGLRYFF